MADTLEEVPFNPGITDFIHRGAEQNARLLGIAPKPSSTLNPPPSPAEMVLGFLFDSTHQQVVLIRKQNPDWQRGKLNGLGGKIKRGESPILAMVREFKEESGVNTATMPWTQFGTMGGPDWKVHCFCAADDEAFARVHSPTPEKVNVYSVEKMVAPGATIIPNLKWLLPLAIEALECGVKATVIYE